jgi:hypothetical protein
MRRYVGVGIAALVLSGCGGSSAEEPQTLPTLASVAASPSPSVAALPSAAAGATPQAAAEFAKFFYAQVEEGFKTKNPGLVSSISLPSCKTCANYVNSLTVLRDKNERLEGGHFLVKFAESPGAEGGKTSVDVQVAYSGSTRYAADGTVVRKTPPLVIDEELDLVRMSDTWRVAAVKRVRTR